MKLLWALVLALVTPMVVHGQIPDSAAIRIQVDSLLRLSKSKTDQRTFEEAQQLQDQAEVLVAGTFGLTSLVYSDLCYNQGRILNYRYRLEEARTWFLRCVEIRKLWLGTNHPDYAQALYGLGMVEFYAGQYGDAEPRLLEALAIQENALPGSMPVITTCQYLGILYAKWGRLGDAEPYLLRTESLCRSLKGEMSRDYINSLGNLANLYYQMDRYAEAEPLYEKARMLCEKTLGKEDPDYAVRLANLAMLYNRMSRFEQTRTYYSEALDLTARTLGKNHPNYISMLDGLARVCDDLGEYKLADSLFTEVVDIRMGLFGEEHPETCLALRNRAIHRKSIGQFEQAELDFRKVLEIYQQSPDPNLLEYARVESNLGSLYWRISRYQEAEQAFVRAQTILDTTVGSQHYSYLSNQEGLAILYTSTGRYREAESTYQTIIDGYTALFGPNLPEFASTVSNLGNLYLITGQTEKALDMYSRVRRIEADAGLKATSEYAINCHNLALVNARMNRLDQADTMYREAARVFLSLGGESYPDYAICLSGLADVFVGRGEWAKADSLYGRAAELLAGRMGKENGMYGEVLNNQCQLLTRMGRFQEARKAGLASLDIQRGLVGRDHVDYALALQSLAILYARAGWLEAADTAYAELDQVTRVLLKRALLHMSEQELAMYIHRLNGIRNGLPAFSRLTGDQGAARSYEQSLFSKGFLLNASSRLRHLAGSSPESGRIFREMTDAHRQLAGVYADPERRKDSLLVAGLESRANTLEKELTRAVAGFGETMRQVAWTDVREALHPGEAAIEFVRFEGFGPPDPDTIWYAAQVVLPGCQAPRFVTLCSENALERLLSKEENRKADYVNRLYSLQDRGFQAEAAALPSLAALIWTPLEPLLADVSRIWFAPDGLLHRINLDALPVSDQEVLADRYDLIELGSTRQLILPDTKLHNGRTAALFGGIDYDLGPGEVPDMGLVASRSRGGEPEEPNRGAGSWSALPATEREVGSIRSLAEQAGFSVWTYRAGEATEEAVKDLGNGSSPSPEVIHLATHGYFFPDPGLGRSAGEGEKSVFRISDHPMLRSGLILAGGNAGWRGERNLEGKEDGVLTAYEISQLDLSNTELVVLSACETGLGDIQGNEGVYGLQRAFRIAGVKYLIMSLWQVPDKQTSLLMTTFYRKWLEDGQAIPDAFHAAQKELRELGFDPYQWAGFVLVE